MPYYLFITIHSKLNIKKKDIILLMLNKIIECLYTITFYNSYLRFSLNTIVITEDIYNE